MEDRWETDYRQKSMQRAGNIDRSRPKVMTASMVLSIIGGSLIGFAFLLYIFGSFARLADDGYDYNEFPYFLMNIGHALFWAGSGLIGIGIVLALKKR